MSIIFTLPYHSIRIGRRFPFPYLFCPNTTLIREGVNFFKALCISRVGQFREFIYTDILTQDAVEIDTYFEWSTM